MYQRLYGGGGGRSKFLPPTIQTSVKFPYLRGKIFVGCHEITFKLGISTNLKALFPAKLTESSIEPKHYLNFDVIQCPIFISCPHKKHGEALGSLKKQKHTNHVTFALLIAYKAD